MFNIIYFGTHGTRNLRLRPADLYEIVTDQLSNAEMSRY